MRIERFEMERMQSIWENRVRCNLSESGVKPLRLAELVQPAELADLALGYPQTNGSAELRETIAALYPGADADSVLACNGTAEANFLAVWSLLEPGDEMVLMLPNYMQISGVAGALGAAVTPFRLVESAGRWAPDLDGLAHAVTSRTRLIAICTPNNPTGAVLGEQEIDAVCAAAARAGAWILSDEVYRGAELDGPEAPSPWGRYERVLVACGLSKAYGLPGLRIGWLVGPRDRIAEIWSYKDYTTIAPTMLSDRLARIALGPKRPWIVARTRSILRAQLPIVAEWAGTHGELFDFTAPRAGAIAYLRYGLDVNSTELVERLRDEKSVLVVPGDHFGMDRYLRIGYGYDRENLERGLALFSEFLASIRAGAAVRSR